MNNNANTHDDEIDLVQLIIDLWNEKLIIILSISIVTTLGVIYAFLTKPIYEVSAQLLIPSSAQLSHYNKTPFFNIKPEEAFTLFLGTLENSDHKLTIAKHLKKPHKDQDKLEVFNNIRSIQYANTDKKKNNVIPDIYELSYTGENKEELTSLIKFDLNTAYKNTFKNINNRYFSELKNNSDQLNNALQSEKNTLTSQLNTRKTFLRNSRNTEIKKLEEALKIAKALNIGEPTSFAKLAGQTNSIYINNIIEPAKSENSTTLSNINTENSKEAAQSFSSNEDKRNSSPFQKYTSHLKNNDYLRGKRLLAAEIENLKNLDKDTFFDNEITIIKSKQNLLSIDPKLEQLKILLKEDFTNRPISFFSKNIYSPNSPIKPRKGLIIIISLFLGGILGLLAAIGCIFYKNYNKRLT